MRLPAINGGLAADTLGRFVINTTVGAGGLFDVATPIGIPYHTNDLGITLATYGFGEGPYLVVPVLGPSNVRDLAGNLIPPNSRVRVTSRTAGSRPDVGSSPTRAKMLPGLADVWPVSRIREENCCGRAKKALRAPV